MVCSGITIGQEPSEELKFGKDSVAFIGWHQIRQLDSIREALGEGVSVHFLDNPLFRTMFSWTEGSAVKGESRLLDVTVGKERSKNLKEQRAQKANSRHPI